MSVTSPKNKIKDIRHKSFMQEKEKSEWNFLLNDLVQFNPFIWINSQLRK